MPSLTFDADKQFMQTLSNLQQTSTANSPSDVITNALTIYNYLKRITPVGSNGEQKLTICTPDGKEQEIILP